ncbi:MAG TPA: hypothetical protein VFG01_10080 [Acidobacteriota bacterium]|nr:hypothetical protein [Acidobacteriota bacterium]
MKKRSWFLNFIVTFVITLIVAAAVTGLYSLIAHGEAQIDWEISFLFAIVFSVVIPLSERWNRK